MSRYQLVSTTMCRNEPFVCLGLLSIIDYVDKCIVIDTGSDDGTYEELKNLKKEYPNKILLEQRKIDDGHDWKISSGQVHTMGVPEHVSKFLGDLRREMHDMLDSKWVLTLDGDEVYPESLISAVRDNVNHEGYGCIAISPPFMDFIVDVKNVRQLHFMCRVYNRKLVDIRNNFPYEMHYDKLSNKCLEHWSDNVYCLNPNYYGYVNHFECLVKPNRKDFQILCKNANPLPEVFSKYKDAFPRVIKYIGENV